MTLHVTPCTDPVEWDELVNRTGGHPLQLWGWGELKSRYEWSADRLIVRDGEEIVGSAQVLNRALPQPFRTLSYVPRGPQVADEQRRAEVLDALAIHLKKTRKPIALSIEPDWETGFSPMPKGTDDDALAQLRAQPAPGWLTKVAAKGFAPSDNTGLIPRTLIIDSTQDDDTLMKGFGSSTRQNVRKSFKAADVRFGLVEADDDLAQVLAINQETSKRAGFAVHSDDYHRGIRDLMGKRSQLIAAWEGDQVVAFVWLVVSDTTAFELYGGVNDRGMKLRLNYGLKFYAMQHVREQGVSRYDFNGLLNDGISDFKRQFAKHENMLIGTWDRPLSPLYPVFAKALPTVRTVLKKGVPQAKSALKDPKAAIATLRKN
ncbi:peptidoglycan bridge formation glycyltransferase FemA/FemB family protein [Yimella sp. cx-51]|uniref:lipid II:glycine glycyltransferase FemX n=1 Tax=Yimella sp. cx-51 TaxID=2770551 RepID=UPI00165E6EC3|nr:peptidoglycan bridge formation glycyltransferase FemA/FemB family protein [Yimella sp. cx-51]MBC9956965.1 peptidoglycan bridge formation glycyltransferase FemA/FemB family protein [Yimella sp. cx-51]QTH39181.1 peptidoglycan bridge formation glycyltransferase FemA/FemB family protein [Yimella sp. cx-51]